MLYFMTWIQAGGEEGYAQLKVERVESTEA